MDLAVRCTMFVWVAWYYLLSIQTETKNPTFFCCPAYCVYQRTHCSHAMTSTICQIDAKLLCIQDCIIDYLSYANFHSTMKEEFVCFVRVCAIFAKYTSVYLQFLVIFRRNSHAIFNSVCHFTWTIHRPGLIHSKHIWDFEFVCHF